jgi:hypothetical protein
MTELAIQEPSIGALMQSVIERGITPDSVGVLERMMTMQERLKSKQAEEAFAQAFTALQRGIPKIQATKPVKNKDGSLRYKFAPFEEIMRQAQPFLSEHGFSVSFNTKWDGPRLIVSCKLLHKGGHSQTNEFAARVGDGPPGANAAQADGAVKTLAKRNALCDALNIVVEHDTDGDDARIEGAPITEEQARGLASLAQEAGADMSKLLEFAGGAKVIGDIRSARYDDVRLMLEKKLRQKKQIPKSSGGEGEPAASPSEELSGTGGLPPVSRSPRNSAGSTGATSPISDNDGGPQPNAKGEFEF